MAEMTDLETIILVITSFALGGLLFYAGLFVYYWFTDRKYDRYR